MKASGGMLALGFAVFLGLRGEIAVAMPLGASGLGLLGWIPFGPAGFSQRTQKTAGQTSHVRRLISRCNSTTTAAQMRGRIMAGSHQGAALEALDVKTLAGCSTNSTRKAARYWWRILTAGCRME